MGHVQLIYEVNCYLSQPSWWDRLRFSLGIVAAVPCRGVGSVWAAARPLGDEEDYAEAARKVVGPLPQEQAERALAELRLVLEAAGVQVSTETVADD